MEEQLVREIRGSRKSVAVVGLSLVVIAVIAALVCLLPASAPVHAGDNTWTWDGVFGNAETILSNSLNPGTAYAIVDNSRLVKTVDSGITWSELPPPPHAGVLLNICLAPDDTNVLYLWGEDSGTFSYRSTDGGNSWQALSKAGVIAISPADWREIYASADGSLYKSTSAGDTWAKVGDFAPACQAPYRFYVAPSAPQVMISVVSPPDSMDFGLCRTMDGGQTWAPLAIRLPVIHAVVFDPKNSNILYLASIGGGWKSINGGTSWQPMGGGLNNPGQFVVDPDNTQVIHAADLNQTGGVFESLDGGQTWTLLDTGIQGLSVRSIAIGSRSPLKIYAGVMVSGVWEITRTTVQDYGITVNDGALFTNDTAVTLTLTAPPGTSQMVISNDGGFGGAVWEPFANTKPWAITAYGDYVIARTVYAKFMTNGQVSGQYQDDIVLDQTAPSGAIQITTPSFDLAPDPASPLYEATDPLTNTVFLPLVFRNYRPGLRPVVLLLSATDDVSGVDGALVSNDATFAVAQWQAMTTGLDWWVSERNTTTVYVKYRDRAGNESPVYSATTTAP